MTATQAIDTLRDGIWVALRMAGPVLLLGMGVGVLVAIFQAATQIHEQTLTFVPKLAVIVVFFLIGGSWMLSTMQEFTKGLFMLMLG